MSDDYSEDLTVSSTESSIGFWGRIRRSFKSVAVGFGFFCAAFPLLFFNEGSYVKTKKSLEEGRGAVVSVSAEELDEANEGKLVHTNGTAKTEQIILDEDFGISVNALKLGRKTMIYQWEERKKKEETEDGETETHYEYDRKWVDEPIDSDRFHRNGPKRYPNYGTIDFPSGEKVADPVTLGKYTLSEGLIDQIETEPLTLTEEQLAKLNENESLWSQKDGVIYRSSDPDDPAIGDLKIEFVVANQAEVSVIAQQSGSAFAPYQTDVGDKLERLQMGVHTSDAMFDQAQDENTLSTRILRGIGIAMMIGGLSGMLMPFKEAVHMVPLIGGLLAGGVRWFCIIIGSALSMMTIGFAWLFFRPVLGGGLLLGGILCFVVIYKMGSKNRAASG